MQLEFKPDFDSARQRWDSLWKGVNTRPLMLMVVPKAGVKAAEPPRYMSWFDGPFDPVIDQLLAWAQTHEFLGESIPSFCLHFGADTMAGYLGGGWWHAVCKVDGHTDWQRFWIGETALTAAVCLFFALAYKGRGSHNKS